MTRKKRKRIAMIWIKHHNRQIHLELRRGQHPTAPLIKTITILPRPWFQVLAESKLKSLALQQGLELAQGEPKNVI